MLIIPHIISPPARFCNASSTNVGFYQMFFSPILEHAECINPSGIGTRLKKAVGSNHVAPNLDLQQHKVSELHGVLRSLEVKVIHIIGLRAYLGADCCELLDFTPSTCCKNILSLQLLYVLYRRAVNIRYP